MTKQSLPSSVLILGCGYVGSKLAAKCLKLGIRVKASVRNEEAAQLLRQQGLDVFCAEHPHQIPSAWLEDVEAIVDSIPLAYNAAREGKQIQSDFLPLLLPHLPKLRWAAYLSSTSVYACSNGHWIDEENSNFSNSPRGLERVKAEQAWLSAFENTEVFRLAGIYGNERNIVGKLFAGDYKAVSWLPEHFSNRIHVDDIVAALIAAMQKPVPQRILNLADDYPCPHAVYAAELATLVGAPAPIILNEQEAKQQLSPAFLSFFKDNKRIDNKKLHAELLPNLQYPSFREAAPILLKHHKVNP